MRTWEKVEPWDDEVKLVHVAFLEEDIWSFKAVLFFLFRYPISWWMVLKRRLSK